MLFRCSSSSSLYFLLIGIVDVTFFVLVLEFNTVFNCKKVGW